jgi:hypothetical protein
MSSSPQVPFGDALLEAVKGLRGAPALLGAVAIAIILGAVAIVAGDTARTIALPLLGLLALALLAWVYTDTQRARRKEAGVLQGTAFGTWSKQARLEIKRGPVDARAGTRVEQNVKAGIGSKQEDVTIESGKVTTH